MAFLKRAVAINSIVRVILRMLRIDLRRLSSARALAMNQRSFVVSTKASLASENPKPAAAREARVWPRLGRSVTSLEFLDSFADASFDFARQIARLLQLAEQLALAIVDELQEIAFPLAHLGYRNIIDESTRSRVQAQDLIGDR